jgi:hypothetical protein
VSWNGQPFIAVPHWVLQLGLSPRALQLYVVLASYVNNRTREATVSRRLLAEQCVCHPDTVDRMLRELVQAGAITAHRRRREGSQSYAPTLYRLPRQQVEQQLALDEDSLWTT